MNVEQVRADQQRSGRVDVHVRVVETGKREPSFEIDDAGLRPAARADLHRGPDRDDAVAFDGHGLGPGLRRVECVDAAIGENQVGVLRRGRCGRSQGGNEHQSAHGGTILPPVRRTALALVLLLSASLSAQTLRWGGDAEGGSPFVEADPNDPAKLKGFDVEIAEMIARELGMKPEFVQITFTSLDQSAHRGDFDIGLSGIEDTPARRATLAVTVPYYEFKEVMTVRAADEMRFRAFEQMRGRRVGTLGGTIAYELLLQAERVHGIVAVSYDDDVHPYTDLAAGRVDAVVLDNVLADRAMRRVPGLVTHPGALATGYYVGILSPDRRELLAKIDSILVAAMGDGRLERIFRKWNVWNDYQPALYARVRSQPRLYASTIDPFARGPSVWDH